VDDTIKIEISDETKNKTTQCPYDFHCLTENARPVCEIDKPMCYADYLSKENGLFIKPVIMT